MYSSHFRPPIKYITSKQLSNLFETQSENASAKIAIIVQQKDVEGYELRNRKKTNWHQLPQYTVHVFQTAFGLSANNFFFDVINKATQQLKPAGIIDRIIEQCYPFKRTLLAEKNWKVLKLNDLIFGFVIWMGWCMVCTGVFFGECVFKNLRGKRIVKKKIVKLKYAKIHPTEL